MHAPAYTALFNTGQNFAISEKEHGSEILIKKTECAVPFFIRFMKVTKLRFCERRRIRSHPH